MYATQYGTVILVEAHALSLPKRIHDGVCNSACGAWMSFAALWWILLAQHDNTNIRYSILAKTLTR